MVKHVQGTKRSVENGIAKGLSDSPVEVGVPLFVRFRQAGSTFTSEVVKGR